MNEDNIFLTAIKNLERQVDFSTTNEKKPGSDPSKSLQLQGRCKSLPAVGNNGYDIVFYDTTMKTAQTEDLSAEDLSAESGRCWGNPVKCPRV